MEMYLKIICKKIFKTTADSSQLIFVFNHHVVISKACAEKPSKRSVALARCAMKKSDTR